MYSWVLRARFESNTQPFNHGEFAGCVTDGDVLYPQHRLSLRTEHSTMALPDVSKDIEARLVDSERCDTVARGENVVSGASASCVSDMRV